MAVNFLNDVSLGSDIELQFSNTSGGKMFANSKFYIQGDAIMFRSYDGGETHATFTYNGDVSLRYNNVVKFETESFGTSTKGYLQIDNDPDTATDIKTAINVGTSDNTGSSAFAVSVSNDAEDVFISSNLFYNGSGGQAKPLNSLGSSDIYMFIGDSSATRTGDIIFGGHYAISGGAASSLVGHMVVQGTGNVGIGVNNPQVKLHLGDNAKIGLGAAGATPDLTLRHNGTNSYIENATGDLYVDSNGDDLYLQSDDDVIIRSQGSENAVYCTGNAGVQLYHNASQKFQTTSSGVSVTGNCTLSSDGNLVLDPDSGIELNTFAAPGAGAEGNGIIIKLHSTSTTFGKLYYKSNLAASWSQANAGSDGATRMLGVALGTSSANDGMLLQGLIRIASHGLSAGAPIYVSTTNGEFTTTPPSSGGDYVRVVGYTIDSNIIYFNPSGTWVEVSN